MRGYYYLFFSLFLATYSQIIIKWKVTQAGSIPNTGLYDQFVYLCTLLSKPLILSAFVATFASGILWMSAISILELSKAYPFIGINFIVMFYCGVLLFDENFSWLKLCGTIIVILGISIITKN